MDVDVAYVRGWVSLTDRERVDGRRRQDIVGFVYYHSLAKKKASGLSARYWSNSLCRTFPLCNLIIPY